MTWGFCPSFTADAGWGDGRGRAEGVPRAHVCVRTSAGHPLSMRVESQSPSVSKVRSKSAATLTAIVAGSLPVMSASPIGVLTRSMVASS